MNKPAISSQAKGEINAVAARQNIRVQQWVAVVSVVLLGIKFFAYYSTGSVTILSDALESIINVIAGFIGLYSLYVAAKPRDHNHPYGHGKAEFISSAIEGTLVCGAGGIILYKAVQHFIFPTEVVQINLGMKLLLASGIVNLLLGFYCLKTGRKNNSAALTASGKHLLTDTWTTVGVLLGLFLLSITTLYWIDSVVAFIFGVYIIFTGYKIIRSSIAGIMDEADMQLLNRMVEGLNRHRNTNWVDLHNLRVIKYGSVLHVDCHLTVPWFLNIHQAHVEIDALSSIIRNEFGESLELFVHSDGCMPFQCSICKKKDCPERQHPFEKTIEWTMENVIQNKKHGDKTK